MIDCFTVALCNWPEKAMAHHSSTLAWKIPWMEEPGGLQSMGSLGVGHNWPTSPSLFTFTHWRRQWQPTPVFLPGESQGQGSLVGCRLWGCTESDTTEVTWQKLFHSVLQGQIYLLLQVSLDFLLLHSSPLWWKRHLFWVLIVEGLVGLPRTVQLQLLQLCWLGHRLRLLWYWMVCLGNEQRSFCRFWDCIQVLHFRLFCWLWWLLHFF